MVFTIQKQILVFGRFLDKSGVPLADHKIKQGKMVSFTDEEGYFDLDLPVLENQDITIKVQNYICEIPAAKLGEDLSYADVGDITCIGP